MDRERIEQGVRMIDTVPRTGIRGSQVAFLHPAASGSVRRSTNPG